MTQPILVPIDGSDNANAALDLAAFIAAKSDAPLKILHIGLREPGPLEDRYDAAETAFSEAVDSGAWVSKHPTWTRHLQVLEYMGHSLLDEAEARARSKGAAKVETAIDWGEAGERILHHAQHPPCAMIVVGSRGASPIEGALLGSVSHKVFYLAPCTCITVHVRGDGGSLEQVERLLVPYDGSDHARKALELACDMAVKFGASLKVLHVLERGRSPQSLRAGVDLDRLDDEARGAIDKAEAASTSVTAGLVGLWATIPDSVLRNVGEERLAGAARLAATRGVDEIDTVLLDGDPAAAILATAQEDRADMIVMGMRGLGELEGLLLGSVSYKVNNLANCSCITVR